MFPSGEVRSETEQVDTSGADVDQKETFGLRCLQQLDLCGRRKGRRYWIVIRRAIQSAYQHVEPHCSHELEEKWSKLITFKWSKNLEGCFLFNCHVFFCSPLEMNRLVWQLLTVSCTPLVVSMVRHILKPSRFTTPSKINGGFAERWTTEDSVVVSASSRCLSTKLIYGETILTLVDVNIFLYKLNPQN